MNLKINQNVIVQNILEKPREVIMALSLAVGTLVVGQGSGAEAEIQGLTIAAVNCPKDVNVNKDVTVGVRNDRAEAITIGIQTTKKDGTVIDGGKATIAAKSGEPFSFPLLGNNGIEDGSVKLTDLGQPANTVSANVNCLPDVTIAPSTTIAPPTSTTSLPPQTTTSTTRVANSITTTTAAKNMNVAPGANSNPLPNEDTVAVSTVDQTPQVTNPEGIPTAQPAKPAPARQIALTG